MILCAVRCCGYIADSSIEGVYPVCALHDAPHTRRLLDLGQRPCFAWMDDRPIVCPCGELDESDFVERAAPESAMHCWDDPLLAEVPDTLSRKIFPAYDLTNHLGL